MSHVQTLTNNGQTPPVKILNFRSMCSFFSEIISGKTLEDSLSASNVAGQTQTLTRHYIVVKFMDM